jgi:sugar-specific transcriptional regulator TrmB
LRKEEELVGSLQRETDLSMEEAKFYLELLKRGSVPADSGREGRALVEKGMAIVSGDDKRIVPVHPRLGVANYYRAWREREVREINDRRMRVDSLILELIPVFEGANEKRGGRGGRD